MFVRLCVCGFSCSEREEPDRKLNVTFEANVCAAYVYVQGLCGLNYKSGEGFSGHKFGRRLW